MNDTNGNAHQKAFELSRVKSPEELIAESSRRLAPQARGAVNFSSDLSMAAKGFFGALVDLSFLHCYGGSGRGKIFISIKDLSRLLKHDKDSITSWRDQLCKARVLWVRESWPKSEWRICALCAAPETDFRTTEYQMIMGKAAALESTQGKPSALSFCDQNGHSPRISEEIPISEGSPSADKAETFRFPGGNLPLREGNPSATNGGNLPLGGGQTSPTPAETFREHRWNPSASRGETFRTNKETPREIGRSGANGGGETPAPIPTFDVLDEKMYPRKRRIEGEAQIEYLRDKIHTLRNTTKPASNRDDIIEAYKARIREIKAWVNGVSISK